MSPERTAPYGDDKKEEVPMTKTASEATHRTFEAEEQQALALLQAEGGRLSVGELVRHGVLRQTLTGLLVRREVGIVGDRDPEGDFPDESVIVLKGAPPPPAPAVAKVKEHLPPPPPAGGFNVHRIREGYRKALRHEGGPTV